MLDDVVGQHQQRAAQNPRYKKRRIRHVQGSGTSDLLPVLGMLRRDPAGRRLGDLELV